MKCTHCGWVNPPSYSACYNCEQPLAANVASVAKAKQVPPPVVVHAPKAKKQKLKSNIPVAAYFPSFWMRAVSAGIDLAVIALFGAIGATIWYFASGGMSSDTQVIGFVVIGITALLIPGVMDAFSASPGKRTTEMMVVTSAGQKPGMIRASIRHILRYCFHFSFPFVLAFLERVLFSHRGLHNVLMNCYIVNAGAPQSEIRLMIARDKTNGASKAVAIVFAAIIIALISFVGLGAIISATEEPNPTRDALKVVTADMKPITGYVSDYVEQMQRFPENVDALGLPQLPPGIAAITMHADSASIHAALDDSVAAGVKGKTLIWQTEMKTRRGALRTGRWRCGSIDITHDDLPYLCRSNVK